jgi:hypothetical protein
LRRKAAAASFLESQEWASHRFPTAFFGVLQPNVTASSSSAARAANRREARSMQGVLQGTPIRIVFCMCHCDASVYLMCANALHVHTETCSQSMHTASCTLSICCCCYRCSSAAATSCSMRLKRCIYIEYRCATASYS